jgi:hypothetical protein
VIVEVLGREVMKLIFQRSGVTYLLNMDEVVLVTRHSLVKISLSSLILP